MWFAGGQPKRSAFLQAVPPVAMQQPPMFSQAAKYGLRTSFPTVFLVKAKYNSSLLCAEEKSHI